MKTHQENDDDLRVLYAALSATEVERPEWRDVTFESLGCKNHPTEVAGYHLIDQPWVKLCSQCALNIAVSGRKIGKELSG